MVSMPENPKMETVVDGLEPNALIIRCDFDEPGIHFLSLAIFHNKSH